jgi:hypothetical protein
MVTKKPRFREAKILKYIENFGCGGSQAPLPNNYEMAEKFGTIENLGLVMFESQQIGS